MSTKDNRGVGDVEEGIKRLLQEFEHHGITRSHGLSSESNGGCHGSERHTLYILV